MLNPYTFERSGTDTYSGVIECTSGVDPRSRAVTSLYCNIFFTRYSVHPFIISLSRVYDVDSVVRHFNGRKIGRRT